jgi:hypothetical protein
MSEHFLACCECRAYTLVGDCPDSSIRERPDSFGRAVPIEAGEELTEDGSDPETGMPSSLIPADLSPTAHQFYTDHHDHDLRLCNLEDFPGMGALIHLAGEMWVNTWREVKASDPVPDAPEPATS